MKLKKIFILAVLLFLPFSYFYLDRAIAQYFLAHAPRYEALGDFLSIFGESNWYFATAIGGFVLFKFFKKNEFYAQRFAFLLYINLFSGLLSVVLKNIFGRIRPWGLRDGGNEYGFLLFQNFDAGIVEKFKIHFTTIADATTTYTSFPSGHSTTIFTAATYLWLLFPKQRFLWLFLALLLASGRVMDNDHFLSDITAGALVGTLCTLYMYTKFKEKIR